MIDIIRTDSSNKQFIQLVEALDKELAIRDGDDHTFYHQFNGIDDLQHVLLITSDGEAIACGAFKQFDVSTVEIKRMYTLPAHRGQGLARKLLKGLEIWASEKGYEKCILETGLKQHEAMSLYQNCGYKLIPNYGQYEGIANSRCFSKSLT